MSESTEKPALIAGADKPANSELARYIGPLAAYRGAIGQQTEGGVIIGGRFRRGTSAQPVYVANGAEHLTWDAALASIQRELEHNGAPADMQNEWRNIPPNPSGAEVVFEEQIHVVEVR